MGKLIRVTIFKGEDRTIILTLTGVFYARLEKRELIICSSTVPFLYNYGGDCLRRLEEVGLLLKAAMFC